MALYWPSKKVALDIVDDPHRRPFEGDESYTVIRVTVADLCNYDSYHKVMAHLSELLGNDLPPVLSCPERSHDLFEVYEEETLLFSTDAHDDSDIDSCVDEGTTEKATPSEVQILASTAREGELMSKQAQRNGHSVRGVSLWDGPIPPGSFEVIAPDMRMSTPEYFFLRKANELSFAEAVQLGIELCGKYRTSVTQYDRDKGYDFLRDQRTTKARLRTYLHGARGTKEAKRARKVLRHVTENCSSPMGCYLYLMLCLPAAQGSYGLRRALLSAVFEGEHGYVPASSGKYLAYDLCWPKERVALQYTGQRRPGRRVLEALHAEGMQVTCIADEDLADPHKTDYLLRELCKVLGHEAPEPSEEWRQAREALRTRIPLPTYDHMRLTMDDIERHVLGR